METEKEKSHDSGIPLLCLKWGVKPVREITEGFLEETALSLELRQAVVSKKSCSLWRTGFPAADPWTPVVPLHFLTPIVVPRMPFQSSFCWLLKLWTNT